jgi:DNA-binding transcriptional LysR family regulator
MDRIDEWRIFTEVARKRSFIEAARITGRSPQAITRAVAALEGRVGTRLFFRTTRSVALTSEGERYLERSRAVLGEFDALEHAKRRDAPLEGRISVTAPVLFGQLHVAPVLFDFLRDQPRVDGRLVLLDRVVSLAEEGLDLGLRIGPLPDSSLRARLIGHVRSVVCASPGYLRRRGRPRSPEALAKHACVAFTGTTPVADRWSFPTRGRRDRSVAVAPRMIVNTGQAAIDAALAGLGLVRVMSYQVDAWVARKKLEIVLEAFEPAPLPIHIVELPGVRNRIASAFVERAVDQLKSRLPVTLG